MIVRNFPQNTSDTIAPTSGKKYAAILKNEWNSVACASPMRRNLVM